MNIEDFEIKIKKYDRDNNQVIVNLLISKELEIRGYVVRFMETKFSTYPIWIVTPPAVKGRNKMYFHVVRLKNELLWGTLQQKIIESVKGYVEMENL